MAKNFLEVFPSLNIAEPLRELLALTEVEKVTSTRDRSSIRVYVKSPRLIHKQNIYDLEKGIKDQLFPDKQVTVKIQERYRLSGQYTPEKLLKIYKDSLLLELKHYSIIEYSMFRKSQIRFEQEDLMVLTVEDTMVNRDRTGELKRVLEKVFAERCGLPVEVRFAYIPPSGRMNILAVMVSVKSVISKVRINLPLRSSRLSQVSTCPLKVTSPISPSIVSISRNSSSKSRP